MMPTQGIRGGPEELPDSSPSNILLLGSRDELGSYRALKILAAAKLLSVGPMTCRVIVDPAELERLSALCSPPARSSSMVLALPLQPNDGDDDDDEGGGVVYDGETKYAYVRGGSNVLLRTLADLAPPPFPKSNLRGCDDDNPPGISAAQIDSWLTFAWTSIEIPLDALRRARSGASGATTATSKAGAAVSPPNPGYPPDVAKVVDEPDVDVDVEAVRGAVEEDVRRAMEVLDRHLGGDRDRGTCYMVVGRTTTVADLALAAALGEATALLGGGGVGDVDDHEDDGNGGASCREDEEIAGGRRSDERGLDEGSAVGRCRGGEEFRNVDRWYRDVTSMDCYVAADSEPRQMVLENLTAPFFG